ncbi:hypothetical protein F4861DRAFT_209738 [Xylaria intraflava]|nr:hypothetical protein F4861DRAFT_209738 [Xylaria intraflava]
MGGTRDKGARSVGSWRMVRPVDEPIYCPAPSPLGPDDIICPGSDDETDEAAKAAKRLRYEQCGRHYLQGRPIRILSASLRGPFDKDSGWQNPWLPKSSSQYPYNSTDLPAPSAVHYEHDMSVGEPLNKAEDMNPDSNDSIECHLPSPQSHEDLQFIETPSRFERHSLIRSWAEQVREESFEEDPFWAPGHEPVNSNIKPANKRPAEKEWLKRRPTKKKRPDASQGTGLMSTQTTTQTSLSRSSNKKGSGARKRATNRNFEMTTPSSSPDKAPKETLDVTKNQQAPLYDKNRQSISSTTPTAGNTSTSPRKNERVEEQGPGEERTNTAVSNDMCQRQSQERRHHNNNSYETIDFQDCADDSFCYRTRQLNQVIPPLESNTNCSGAPTSPEHGSTIFVRHSSGVKESNSNSNRNFTGADHPRTSKRSNDGLVAVAANAKIGSPIDSTTKPDQDMIKDDEVAPRGRNMTDISAVTSSSSRVIIDRPSGDIESDECTSNLNIPSNTPPTILEVKGSHGISPGPLLDEESTLIGDQLDTEQPGDAQTKKPISVDASKIFRDDDTNHLNKVHDSIDTMSCVAATTLQHEVVESQSEINRPHQSLGGSINNSTAEANVLGSQVMKGSPRIVEEDQIVPAEQQSPWTHLDDLDGSVQLGDDSIGQTKDQDATLPVSLAVPLLKSPAPMHHSPAIRPSQQSPWAPDTMKSVNSGRRGPSPNMSTGLIITVNTESPGEHADYLLPTDQKHSLGSGPPTAMSPGSCTSSRISCGNQRLGLDVTAGEKRAASQTQTSPHTPISQISRQLTPDGEVSIRSFSNFNCSPPRQSIHYPGSSANRSILSSGKDRRTNMDTKSSRRVSFAPLPHEQDGNSDQRSTHSRAESPPPPTPVDLEGEDVDGKYRAHFSIMNRRLSVHKVRKPRYQQRLLPSSSQQRPASPPVDAMARVFQEADMHRLNRVVDVAQSTEADEGKGVEEVEDKSQSPWRQDSQGADDVAAVIGHLDEFLDVWDVNTEMARNRTELGGADKHGAQPNIDINIVLGAGVW